MAQGDQTPNPKTVKLTVEQIRGFMKSDPEKFFSTLDRIIENSTDPTTKEFWTAVKDFAAKEGT